MDVREHVIDFLTGTARTTVGALFRERVQQLKTGKRDIFDI